MEATRYDYFKISSNNFLQSSPFPELLTFLVVVTVFSVPECQSQPALDPVVSSLFLLQEVVTSSSAARLSTLIIQPVSG